MDDVAVGSSCAKIGSSGMAMLTVGNALCINGGVPLPVAAANNFEDHVVVCSVTDLPTIKSVGSQKRY